MGDMIARTQIGTTGIELPELIFGSSALGNLYREVDIETKRSLVASWMSAYRPPVAIDSAGKYGAGLALEEIGEGLRALGVDPDAVVISNKLGWYRVPLEGDEPTFEPGAWKRIKHDAVQRIDYDGILACWEQGNSLIGAPYSARLVSVHDPDEYLATASDSTDRKRRLDDVIAAYRALAELRASGAVAEVGIGSKDWRVIEELASLVDLDWVMLAGALTVYDHPVELLRFIDDLARSGVVVINSAAFKAGFLVGGDYFDYRKVTRDQSPELFCWRDRFFSCCDEYEVVAADACIEFGLAPEAVSSIALNTTRPSRVAENVKSVRARAPREFWEAMAHRGLIEMVP